MKRKAPTSSSSSYTVGKHPASIKLLSIPMIVSILLLLSFAPVIHSFSLVGGNELVRFRTKCTNSDFSTGLPPLSASHHRTVDHTLSESSSSTSLDEVPTVSPTAESTKDEQAVDEYLEFLDRRYRRLHEDRPSNEFANLPSSVWKWLHQSEDGTTSDTWNNHHHHQPTHPTTGSNTEDVLYVLGVAGLASKKLLQKHHLVDAVHRDSAKETVIDVDHTTATLELAPTPSSSTTTATTTSVVVTAETMVQTFLRLLVNRQALIQYQSRQLKEMMGLVLLRGPTHMIRSLWKFCDGTRFVKRTILMTITLSFLLFRTVSFIIANETA